MNVADVHAFLTSLSDERFPEEGIHYGDARMTVQGVLFCWMANVRAIRQAVDEGCNVIVCHETPFFGRAVHDGYGDSAAWVANRRRRALLEAHGLAVVQSHRSLDAFCVPDVFQEKLGLGRPAVAEKMAGHYAVRLFEIPPEPVGRLIDRWKAGAGVALVRVYAPNLGRPIRRIGLAWGGIGLASNMGVLARLADLGAELLLGGETEEYTIEFCADADLDFVEIGHAASEAPGMAAAAEHFSRRFPDVKVVAFQEPPLYRFV